MAIFGICCASRRPRCVQVCAGVQWICRCRRRRRDPAAAAPLRCRRRSRWDRTARPATQPIDPVGWSSKIGFHVRPGVRRLPDAAVDHADVERMAGWGTPAAAFVRPPIRPDVAPAHLREQARAHLRRLLCRHVNDQRACENQSETDDRGETASGHRDILAKSRSVASGLLPAEDSRRQRHAHDARRSPERRRRQVCRPRVADPDTPGAATRRTSAASTRRHSLQRGRQRGDRARTARTDRASDTGWRRRSAARSARSGRCWRSRTRSARMLTVLISRATVNAITGTSSVTG